VLRPSPISEGTVYFSYRAATDVLAVSGVEYDGADGVAYAGLRASAGTETAGIALGGYSYGPVIGFSGAMAWGDTLVVNAGTIVTDEPCVADVDGNGNVNVDDVQAFASGFLAADLIADCDGSGVLNVDDVQCFAAAFLAGCP
jgi:hypothetical protein